MMTVSAAHNPRRRIVVPFALCAAMVANLACSTATTAGDGTGAAGAGEDAYFTLFDASKSDASKADAGKTDTGKADAGLGDIAKTDASKADAAKTDTATADVAKADGAAMDGAAGEDTATDDTATDDTAAFDAGPDDVALADADAAAADGDAGTAEDAAASDDAADGGSADPFAHLCDPCTQTTACNDGPAMKNVCISHGADGSFCGKACDPADAAACPYLYACTAVTDPILGPTHQCTPTSGTCTCSVAAALAKLSTTCTVTNGTGTCQGTRSCGISGLGLCTAGVAMDEVCNGLDDNCDGQTDEGLCPPSACMAATCDPVTGACTPQPNGTGCDDGNSCTLTDACSFGTCVGTSPSDGNETAPGQSVANKSDCDGTSKLTSVLSPGSDVDWYTFKGSDDYFCSIAPTVRVDQMAGDYDVCVYWACGGGKGGSGDLSCTKGSKVSGGPNGWWGCCAATAGLGAEKVEIDSTCSTLGAGDDGGTAIIQVKAHDPKGLNICGGYTLTWSAASF